MLLRPLLIHYLGHQYRLGEDYSFTIMTSSRTKNESSKKQLTLQTPQSKQANLPLLRKCNRCGWSRRRPRRQQGERVAIRQRVAFVNALSNECSQHIHIPLPIPDAAPVMTAVCEVSFNQDAIAKPLKKLIHNSFTTTF